MRKLNLIGIAVAAMTLAVAGAASAAQTKIIDANALDVSLSGGTLTVSSAASDIHYLPSTADIDEGTVPVSITFGAETGTATVVGGDEFIQSFGGGTFSYGGDLFGTFTGATVTATDGSGGQINYSGVVYNTGSSLLSTGLATFSPTVDTSMTSSWSSDQSYGLTAGSQLADFSATDTSEADGSLVTSTPEPTSVATFGIGAMALVMMAAFARRRNAGAQL